MTLRSPGRLVVRWWIALMLVGAGAFAPGAWAQGGPGLGAATPESATPADLRALEETRARVAEIEAEIGRLEALGEEWEARSAQFAQARQGAAKVLAEIEQEVAQLKRRAAPTIAAGRGLAELETDLLGEEQDLTVARKDAAALDTEALLRAERRKQIPDLMAAAKERLRALGAETTAPAGDPALADARQRLLRIRREVTDREIGAYEEELRSYDARGQLLTLRRERAVLRVAALEAQVHARREALAARRQGEAELAAQEAERSLEFDEPVPAAVLDVVRSLAAENRELALRRTGPDGLLQKIEESTRKLGRAEEMVADVSADLELLRRNEEAAGLSSSVGLLLRRAQSEVPDMGMYRRFIRMRRDQISEAQIQQIELIERRRSLDDVDAATESKLAKLGGLLSPEEAVAVEERVRSLLETQRRALDTLIADAETYFEKLVDFDARQRELVSRSEVLKRFIDERILWIPSAQPLSLALATDVPDALGWLFAPRFWGQLLRAAANSIGRAPVSFAGAGLLLLALPLLWPRTRARIVQLGDEARDPGCTRMAPTSSALLLSVLLAFWGPGLSAFLAWRLRLSVDATQFVRCFASGLMAAAFVWASLELPRQLLRSGGIAIAHLTWKQEPARQLRRELRWLAAVAVPAIFVIAVFDARGEEAWTASVGRLAFLLTMVAVIVFTHRILREGAGALRRLESAQGPLPPWTWRIVHLAVLAVGVGLTAATLRGYYWTSLQLATSFHVTFVFLFLVVFAYQLGTRWRLLASRRLALRRWHKAQAEREADVTQAPPLKEPEVDLATVDEHTGRLLRNGALLAAAIGVWLIWADLLPAAGALRSVELWKTSATETVEMMNASGELVSSLEERLVPITLADLLLALLAAAATLVLVRNLPGLLEISMFRPLPISAGERYAYATICKYAVTVVGVAAALHIVGVGWSNLQWLIAAVGIGLGFGLQEIFANFISGLIILFERPIRVGDTVTVGDISGTVTKIRIRATWITGFDRKELVVPNKEFITGRLVNWSLSDAVLRIEIPVGVAYGSDTEKAHRVLEEVAKRNEHVLDEPAPYALFRGFGNSSLDFELRVFSPDVSHYLKIVHELHMEIDRAFRAEGIEIAFPQRDIHVRSVPADHREAIDEQA